MPWAMTGSKNTARETPSLLSLRETIVEKEGLVYMWWVKEGLSPEMPESGEGASLVKSREQHPRKRE